jgi:hypothetical protein
MRREGENAMTGHYLQQVGLERRAEECKRREGEWQSCRIFDIVLWDARRDRSPNHCSAAVPWPTGGESQPDRG